MLTPKAKKREPQEMRAIISDIHGNIEALQAVLEDIERLGIREIICLGDIVGYGPEPRECLDIVQNVSQVVILGNHEEAVLQGVPLTFTPRARRALDWTRRVLLDNEEEPESKRDARRQMMAGFKMQYQANGSQFVHGSPRDPTREYVLPRDAVDRRKLHDVFAAMKSPACFCGHTHTPGVFTPQGFTHPSDMLNLYMLGSDEKVLINVGSVGQPRDGDPRACYATYDGDTVVWRRVSYDVDKTCDKIYAIPELDQFLADRLREGR